MVDLKSTKWERTGGRSTETCWKRSQQYIYKKRETKETPTNAKHKENKASCKTCHKESKLQNLSQRKQAAKPVTCILRIDKIESAEELTFRLQNCIPLL